MGGKLPASGGGQGNVTHAGAIEDLLPHYHGGEKPGDAGRFLRPALYAFSNRDLAAWLATRGLPTVEDPDGRVFPRSRKAADVLELLLAEARTRGVALRPGVPVGSVWVEKSGFSVFAPGARRPLAQGKSLVLSPGGRTYGGTGDGYRIAASLGHRVVPPRPALVPLVIERRALAPFAPCAGVSLRGVRVTVRRGGKRVAEAEGDVLFTHRGLSGPAILDLSRHVVPGDTVHVPLLPGAGEAPQAEERLRAEIAAHGGRTVGNLLRGLGVAGCLARAVAIALGLDPGMK
ncbi:MAG: NAD(P)/FAD-dependent oxidoreductase, partial [Candidatus Bipolaricaulota bacterium]|nr:NAD(P)/FAD-dependent oxidoreductase [Candidatus Bipolaricaulota bacterium]